MLPKDNKRKDKEDMEEFEIVINGIPYKFKADSAGRIAAQNLLSAQKKADEMADSEKKIAEALQAKLDAMREELDTAKAELAIAKSPEAIAKAASTLANTRAKAEVVAGEKIDGDNEQAIKIAALEKAGVNLEADLEGKSDSYKDVFVSARFDAVFSAKDSEKDKNNETNRAANLGAKPSVLSEVIDKL